MMANIKLNLKDVHSTAMQVRLSVSDMYRSTYQKVCRNITSKYFVDPLSPELSCETAIVSSVKIAAIWSVTDELLFLVGFCKSRTLLI